MSLVLKSLGLRKSRRTKNELNKILYGQLVNQRLVVFYDYTREDFITKGYSSNAEVYTIIRKIVDKAAVAEPYVYIDKNDVKSRRYKNKKKSKDVIEISKHRLFVEKSLEFAELDNDLANLLKQPNTHQSWRELIELFRIFYFVQGEAFLYRETGVDTDIAVSLHVAPAHLMEPVFGGDYDNIITGWRLNMLNGYERILDSNDVFHMKMANPNFDQAGTQLRGMSPLMSGLKYMQLDDKAIEAWIKSVEHEGAKGIVSPNHSDPKLWLTPDQREKTQKRVDTEIHGVENKNKIVVSGMPLQYTQIGLSPDALNIIEGLKHANYRLCDLWGVPPVLFDPNPTYQNQKEAAKRFVLEVILPYLNKEEDALNRWLVEPFKRKDNKNYVIDYDVSAYDELKLSLDDVDALLKIHSINEVRVMIGSDEVDDPMADEIMVSQDMIPLSDYSVDINLNE